MPKKMSEIIGSIPNLSSTDSLNKMNEILQESMMRKENPAKFTYERLGVYIKEFEKDLDDEHEIGARLVTFGQSITFHITNIGYYGPDIISFDGFNQNGEKLKLIQNISQLSVLLIAMKKLEEKPRRIGFIWDDDGSKKI
ncbi:MAG: DUF6173 family protein [Candidatus Competibacter sp.]